MMLKPGFGSASRTLLAVLLLPLASPAVADGPERSGVVRFSALTVTPLHVNANLLTNPGFEEGAGGGIPVGWEWSRAKHRCNVPDRHDDTAFGQAEHTAHERHRVRIARLRHVVGKGAGHAPSRPTISLSAG